MGAAKRSITIVNKRGLHARASAKFVGAAAQMEGTRITVTKDGASAHGTSILGLMMLGAAKGDSILIHVSGDHADAAMARLVALIEERFGEE